MVRIPFDSGGIGKIYNGHSRLPLVGLIYRAIRVFEEIAAFFTFGKKRRALGDVGVYPHADFYTFRFYTR